MERDELRIEMIEEEKKKSPEAKPFESNVNVDSPGIETQPDVKPEMFGPVRLGSEAVLRCEGRIIKSREEQIDGQMVTIIEEFELTSVKIMDGEKKDDYVTHVAELYAEVNEAIRKAGVKLE